MQHWQQPFLGLREFPLELTEFETRYFFSFSPQEHKAIQSRRGVQHRLAAAIHLGFIKLAGRTLDAFHRIPHQVLVHLGQELDVQVPELSTLRALYSRGSTLFEHQIWAAKTLGFRPFTDGRQRVLVRQLRPEAHNAVTINGLVEFAKRWLYDQRILIPGAKRLKGLASQAYREAERDLFARVEKTIPQTVRDQWLSGLFEKYHGHGGVLEWLHKPSKGRSEKTLREQLAKLELLKSWEVHRYGLEDIRLERQRGYARRMRRRRPSRFRQLRNPRRTLELVCFLRVTYLQITDVVLSIAEMKTVSIKGEAVRKAGEFDARSLREARERLQAIEHIIKNSELSDAQVGQRLRSLEPIDPVLFKSRAAVARWILSEDSRAVRKLLKKVMSLGLEGSEDALVFDAVRALEEMYQKRRRALPDDIDIGFAQPWRDLLNDSDRERAFRAFEVATLSELRKALRNGSVWVPTSLTYRNRDQILINSNHWVANKKQYYKRLGVPTQPSGYVQRLIANVKVGLEVVAQAVRDGEVTVDEEGLHMKALEAEEDPPLVASTKKALFREIGKVQLPELIVAIDHQIRFSWVLLGRAPNSENELLALYGALLAHGTELDAASVALMIPGLSEEAITDAMRLLEDNSALRRCNELAVEFLRRHDVVEHWGHGTIASADSMSLDVSRHVWNARIDPRRRTLGVGMYTHVLDQWGIIYDQAIVLGQRQAGPAIEGMVRQTAAADIERLAVDTHGYTDFAMALAKLLGFDLCPRLKSLRERRLHIPPGMRVPDEIESIVERDVSQRQLNKGWDELIRVAASIEGGWTSAVLALERFGSAARADPIHKAGTALGKLLRTVFLCDYVSNPSFRRAVLRILNHGESVHSLQRVIHFGSIAAAHGRRREELVAISGSLTLLTNLAMAWTTHQMQCVLDGWTKQGRSRIESEVLRHIAPLHFRGINFRGEFHFPITRYGHRLMPGRFGLRRRR